MEDESQQAFLRSVSRVLGHDLDSAGVTLLATDGEGNYKTTFALLDTLGIPYLALKDKTWGDDTRYPPDRFFTLGGELEDFLDSHGLGSLRSEGTAALGKSTRRIAGCRKSPKF